MSLIRFIAVFTLNVLYSISSAQVYIRGEIKGSAHNKLSVFAPVNGIANIKLIQEGSSVTIDSLGRFEYTFLLTDPCFVTLQIGYEPVWLLLQPDDSLQVNINLDSVNKAKHSGWLVIKGNNSEGHLFFNEWNYQPITKLLPVMDLLESIKKQPIDLIGSMQDTIAKTLKPFDSLFANHEITPAYHSIITTTIKANLISEALKYFFRGSSLYSAYSHKAIDSLKKGLFALCDPMDTTLYKGLLTQLYLYDFYKHKELEAKGKWLERDLKDSVLIRDDGKKLLVQGSHTPFLHIADERLRENLWAMSLYMMAEGSGVSVDKQGLASFSYFYPNSSWLPYIHRLHDEVTKRIGKAQQDARERKFLDSIQAITSLQQVSERLKGQPLFIDLWASWCAPCLQEFLSKNAVDSFLNVHGIIKVYISVDNPMVKEGWLNAIAEYNLKGYHILASRPLVEDLRNKVYKEGEKNLPIPRYIIVNSSGQIIEPNAFRPSAGQQLINHIRKVLLIN